MRTDIKDRVRTLRTLFYHELSSVAPTIANGGMTAGLKVLIFLTSSGVVLVRKRGTDTMHVSTLEPLSAVLEAFLKREETPWACTPGVKARGYTQDDLIPGTTTTGASAMHELHRASVTTLSF